MNEKEYFEQIKCYKLIANKSLGQNFLINPQTAEKIVNLLEIKDDDKVLEIGAGQGVLSAKIAPLCKDLQIVEIDDNLQPYLCEIARKYHNVSVCYTNALKYSFCDFDKIITSLPYNILEPFLYKCVKEKVCFIVMLIGDKYALNLKNFEQDKSITFIQLLSHTFFNCTVDEFVPKQCFSPAPRTGSYIVKLERKATLTDLDFIVAEIFNQSDKKIKSALKESLIRLYKTKDKTLTQRQAKEIIEHMNIDDNILDCFFSNLTNEQLSILYEKISENINSFN